jgi:ATPase subunit of ABC transporter with duplicated ATPase domains
MSGTNNYELQVTSYESGRGTDLVLKDLSVGYPGRTLIEGVDAVFPAWRLTAITGRNGTGKSTLLRVMAGLAKPLAGEVRIRGERVGSSPVGVALPSEANGRAESAEHCSATNRAGWRRSRRGGLITNINKHNSHNTNN